MRVLYWICLDLFGFCDCSGQRKADGRGSATPPYPRRRVQGDEEGVTLVVPDDDEPTTCQQRGAAFTKAETRALVAQVAVPDRLAASVLSSARAATARLARLHRVCGMTSLSMVGWRQEVDL